ncbi:unnamed protein product [Ixodes hexagonus]
MLFHVLRILWDFLIVLSIYRCPKGGCWTNLLTAFASVVYHVVTLLTYYRWFEVAPAEKPPCMVGICYDRIQQYLRTLRESGQHAANAEPPCVQLEKTLGSTEECSASFEFSHRRTAVGATEHLISSHGSFSQENVIAT